MEIIKISLGILIALNIAVSIFIAKRDDLDSFQKKTQIFMVWLIPFIGAIGLWFFNKSHDEKHSKEQPFGGGEQSSIDVGGGYSGESGGGSD